MTITVICTVCNSLLVTAEGANLTQNDADNYQNSVSCNTDGTAGIQVETKE